jgi:peroxiredoxin (alkyl hydroperoxide reductase subunit C)
MRLIDAQLHVEKFGEVCPANWEEGKAAMQATTEGVANYLSNN